MCGIVGYIGDGQAADIILDALKRLEYRGYDSSGIATLEQNALHLTRAVGKLSYLEAALQSKPQAGQIGIGHTRWATFGAFSNGILIASLFFFSTVIPSVTILNKRSKSNFLRTSSNVSTCVSVDNN